MEEDALSMWDELLKMYSEEEAELFLRTPQPFMGGLVPSVEMAKGNSQPIWDWIDGWKDQIAT